MCQLGMLPMCLQGQARFQLYQKLAALVFALVQVTMHGVTR